MKLNLEIIRTYLPDSETIKSYAVESRKLIFRRPLLYEPGMELKSGNLYVMHNRDFPRSEPVHGVGIICVGDQIPYSWTVGAAQILCLRKGPRAISIFNQVCQIFDMFDEWDNRLRDELEKELEFDIGRLMLLGSEMLENPFRVSGQSLETIFNVNHREDESGVMRLFLGPMPHDFSAEYAERVKQVCALERPLTVPFISNIDLPGEQYYCYNLYSMGYFVGCVSLGADWRPFRESDFPLADHFFGYFQKAFFKYLRSHEHDQSPEAEALQKFLRHEIISEEEMMLFRLESDESWIFFKISEKKGKRVLPREDMCGTLNALLPQKIVAVMFHKEIVGMLRLRGSDHELLGSFAALLKRLGYFAGLSHRFQNMDRLDDFLLQAHYVVEHHISDLKERTVYDFGEHALEYLLHICTSEMDTQSLISRSILSLADHDRMKGTEYIKTLDTYLCSEMGITETAEKLFIHRSSLLKRLDKIRMIIEDDLDDPRVRLYYRLCLALMK